MKTKFTKIGAVLISLALIITLFSSCDFTSLTSSNKPVPEEVSVKTDLKDAEFTFTYGELKNVLPADKLGSLFENYEELNDDITITLSYNEIELKYGEDEELFNAVMALASEEEKAALTANSDEVLNYFVTKINEAKQLKPIVQYDEYFWVDKDTIDFSQNGAETDEKVKTAAKFFSDFVTDGAGEKLKSGTTEKGDDLTDILYLLGSDKACELTSDNVESVISSLSRETETVTVKEEVTKKNGKTKTEKVEKDVVTGITRTIVIVLKDDEESVNKAFSMRDKSPVLEEMKKASSYFTVDDYSTAFKGCKITITVNAVTDDILTVTYDKNMTVSTNVTGVGSLEYLGTQDLKFNCTDRMEYKFGWEAEAK